MLGTRRAAERLGISRQTSICDLFVSLRGENEGQFSKKLTPTTYHPYLPTCWTIHSLQPAPVCSTIPRTETFHFTPPKLFLCRPCPTFPPPTLVPTLFRSHFPPRPARLPYLTLPGTVRIAVIGGSGLTSMPGYTPIATVNPLTPWGHPSAPIQILTHHNVPIAFLSRHGASHEFAPHEVPNRANIAALRSIGVRTIIAFSAVGSLREEVKPRDFVVPDQVIDRTKGTLLISYKGRHKGKRRLIRDRRETVHVL